MELGEREPFRETRVLVLKAVFSEPWIRLKGASILFQSVFSGTELEHKHVGSLVACVSFKIGAAD